MKHKWFKIFVIEDVQHRDGPIFIKDMKQHQMYLCRKCYYKSIIATNYCPNCGRKYKKRYE